MKILLVHPPCDATERAYPLGLASLAAALTREGHEVAGLDLNLRPRMAWPTVAEGFDVVGLSAMSSTWPAVVGLLRTLPTAPKRLVVVGGPHATLYPEEVLAESIVDAVARGEGDEVLLRLLQTWAKTWGRLPNLPANSADWQSAPQGSLPGVIWQRRWLDRGFSSAPAPQRLASLDRLPTADRSLLPLAAYGGMATRRRYTQIVASRGCRRACAHCPASRLLPGGRRARPVEQVVEEMRMVRDRYGVEEFHFEDDSFFEDREYVLSLCQAIRQGLPGTKGRPAIAWQCPNGSHPSDLDAELLPELAAAGCYRIYLGLHSTSPEAMHLLGRPWEPESLAPLCQAADRAGIELGGYFTLGLPGETEAERQATIRYAVRSGLKWAQFTRFCFTPGSVLFDRREELGGSTPTARKITRDIRRAYWQFYGMGGRWLGVVRGLDGRNFLSILVRGIRKMF